MILNKKKGCFVYLIRAATAKDMQNVEKLTELVFNDTFVRDVIEKEEGI